MCRDFKIICNLENPIITNSITILELHSIQIWWVGRTSGIGDPSGRSKKRSEVNVRMLVAVNRHLSPTTGNEANQGKDSIQICSCFYARYYSQLTSYRACELKKGVGKKMTRNFEILGDRTNFPRFICRTFLPNLMRIGCNKASVSK